MPGKRFSYIRTRGTVQASMTPSVLFESVVLVEDDASHALLIQRALNRFCAKLRHVETLAAAEELLSSGAVELIITDLNLSDASRLSTVKRLKQAAPETPIVVLTSSTSLQDAVEAMKLGAHDFIVKEFSANFQELIGLALSRVHASQLLEQERRRLQREMEALRSAIENSKDGLAVTSESGEIVYRNRSFDEFVKTCGGKCDRLELLFSPLVVEYEQLIAALGEKFRTLAGGAVWHTEVRLREDGYRAFDISLSIIRRRATGMLEVSGNECVIWVRDISEQKRRDKFQRDILATTTHDLKNPLAAIRLSADLLVEMAKGMGRVSDLALRVQASAETALNMIDEFLSARRIQEGTFILKPSAQNVVGLVDEVLGGFEASAAAHSIRIVKSYERAELVWPVDRIGFERVLSNLLSNAIKFSQHGSEVRVSVRVHNSELWLGVADSGSGLEPGDVQRIFERFSRLERHSDVPGSGIGLFVVKSIVNAHAGRIEVTSQPGKGTSFEVMFPGALPVNAQGELISLDFA